MAQQIVYTVNTRSLELARRDIPDVVLALTTACFLASGRSCESYGLFSDPSQSIAHGCQ